MNTTATTLRVRINEVEHELPSGSTLADAVQRLRFDGLGRIDAQQLQVAMVRQGLEIVSVERHGTRGKDIRVFIAARKPG